MLNAILISLIGVGISLEIFIDGTTGRPFPSEIPLIPVRLDSHTNEPVSRGRFESFGGFSDDIHNITRLSFDEFTKQLQCAPTEPALYERMTLLKLIPYTRDNLKAMCASLETSCRPWKACHELVKKFESGGFSSGLSWFLTSPSQTRLRRLVNNTLYQDFPWGLERFVSDNQMRGDSTNHKQLLHMLRMVELPDAVWAHAAEFMEDDYLSFLPSFSNSPSFKHGNMPWPWQKDMNHEAELYSHLRANKDFSYWGTHGVAGVAAHEHEGAGVKKWHERKSVAVFAGTIKNCRKMIYDLANLYPDAVATMWSGFDGDMTPWNPSSLEDSGVGASNIMLSGDMVKSAASKPGYLEGYVQNRIVKGVSNYWLHYKYNIVLLGNGGHGTADRLGWLLAHSGSVVMLQASQEFLYSFSPRLIPFVHFIPIMYTGADIVEKVRWLQANDDLALRIVENARNFGKSYLRLEDHYCYMARALKEVGDLSRGSDVLKPFGDAEHPNGYEMTFDRVPV